MGVQILVTGKGTCLCDRTVVSCIVKIHMIDQIVSVPKQCLIVILVRGRLVQNDRFDPMFIFKIDLTVGARYNLLAAEIDCSDSIDTVFRLNDHGKESVL